MRVLFYKTAKVRERWKTPLQHFYCDTYKREPVEQATLERARDLATEPMVEMAKDLGYAFDHTFIKDNAYLPKLHGGVETPRCSFWTRALRF